MAPKGFSFGVDKKQMVALGDAVKARLEMERDFDTVDALRPPPQALSLEGAVLPGMAAGFVGLYTRHEAREIEGGAPAYRNVRNPVLWLARDAEGVWRGQIESKMGKLASMLKLADSQAIHPSSATDEAWQYIDPDTKDWEKQWQLRCREATEDEVEAERAAWPPVPPVLVLEGSSLPGAMAAGFVGVYTRGQEWDATARAHIDRLILGTPCWRQVQNPCLWLCRAPDGGWIAQGEDSLGTQAGFMRLRDTHCLYPSESAAAVGSLLVFTGSGWEDAPAELLCRRAEASEASAVTADIPPPVPVLRVSGEAQYAGVYRQEPGHVNHSPAWRRVRRGSSKLDDEAARSDESLWIVRGRNGCWVGQSEEQLARDAGGLQLPTTGCQFPYELPPDGVVWQHYAHGLWRDVHGLKVEPSDASDLEGELDLDLGDLHVEQHEHVHAHGENEHVDCSDPHGPPVSDHHAAGCGHGHTGECCEHEHDYKGHEHEHGGN